MADFGEKTRIRAIEAEEWLHRDHVGRMLGRLGLRPSPWLEFKYAVIGRIISAACHVIGHFQGMYFAGRLESGNVNEYLHLAKLIEGTVLADELACVLEMARVEKEHEVYFLSRIAVHPWLPWFSRVFAWGPGKSFNDVPG